MSNMKRWQGSPNYANLPIQRGKWWKGNIVKNHTNLTEKCRLSRWGKNFLGRGSDRDLESLYTPIIAKEQEGVWGKPLSDSEVCPVNGVHLQVCLQQGRANTHSPAFSAVAKNSKYPRTWVNSCFFFVKTLGQNLGTKELVCLKGWNWGIRKPNCSYSSAGGGIQLK